MSAAVPSSDEEELDDSTTKDDAAASSRKRSSTEASWSRAPWILADTPVNVLDLPLPAADSKAFAEAALLNVLGAVVILSVAITVLNRLRLSVGWTVAAVGLAIFSIRARVEGLRETFHADIERRRGEKHAGQAESVEWLNSFLRVQWPLINPQLFSTITSLLEEVMREHAPPFVTMCRVRSLDIGSNPMRLLSFRCLPPDADIGESGSHPPTELQNQHTLSHVNLEVKFQYSTAPPGTPKMRNITFISHLRMGVKKAHVDLPVAVKITGTIRMRFSLTSEPPFITHTQISFPQMPKMRMKVKPMRSVNIMNVPGISHYVENAIRLTVECFVAPRSWTLDVSRILMNSEIQLSPLNQGIVVLRINKCEVGDAAVALFDRLLITVELSTSSRAAYSTRALPCGREAICWGETAFVLIPRESVIRDESMRITLWNRTDGDEDRPVNTLTFPLQQLLEDTDGEKSRRDAIDSVLTLDWQASYYGMQPIGKAKPSIPASSRASQYALRIQEMLDSAAAPPPHLPSGLFGIQIHHVAGFDDASQISCAIFLDGKLSARTKATSTGFVDTTCEFFCADIQRAVVCVAVLDQNDKLLGALQLRLHVVFSYRSQSTRWYSLASPMSEIGRVRLSLLFKAIAVHLPSYLMTPEVGTLEISRITVRNLPPFVGRIRCRIDDTPFKLETKVSGSKPVLTRTDSFNEDRQQIEWEPIKPFTIPVLGRQQTNAIFELFPAEPAHQPPHRVGSYHLLDLDATETFHQVVLPLFHKLSTCRANRHDVALPDMHPPSKKKSLKDGKVPTPTSASTSPQKSRDPSPSRRSGTEGGIEDDRPQLVLEVRFVPGLSEAFARTGDVIPTVAARDAELGWQAMTLAMQAPDEPPRGVPVGAMASGDIDADGSLPQFSDAVRHAKSVSGTSSPSRYNPMNWAKTGVRKATGKTKKSQ